MVPAVGSPAHVMSVYVQYTPYRLKAGDWTAGAREVAETVL